MSATTTSPAPAASHDAPPVTGGPHLTFGHLLRSEQIKLWSVRSTPWTLASLVLVMVGIVAGMSALIGSNADEFGMPLEEVSLFPYMVAVQMASLVVVVLGVLTITGEYTTGMIRSTLTAAPTRLPAFWAKAAIVTVTILVVSLVGVALSLGVQWLILGGKGLTVDLADPENLRVLGGTALYLATITLFAYALGALMRHSAAALATIIALLLVIENVFAAIPWKPLQVISPFLPATAGSKLTMPQSQIDMMNTMSPNGADLSAWQGYGVLVLWVAVLLAVAAVLLRRRDA